MKNNERLEELTNELLTRYERWEDETIRYIGARLKKLEKLTPADIKTINNAAEVNRDLDHIFEQLAEVTDKSVAEVAEIYGDVFDEIHDSNSGLYDYRKIPFTPINENEKLAGMINGFSKKTGEELVNLTNTKAIGFVNANGAFGTVKTTIFDALGEAAIGVRSGSVSFHTATKRAIEQLGASGIVIDYGNCVHRSVESVVRANVLYGAKQASEEYNKIVGEEVGCDGIEIDWHPHPRPAHEFIQGRQFVIGKSQTIDGVFFQGADEVDPRSPDELSANKALNQYGCLHSPMPIICGVSEPTYDPEQLKKLNEENAKPIEIDGVTKTGYEWKQSMRRLEREARKEKRQIAGLEGLGNENAIKEHRETLTAIRQKHAEIADAIGSRVDEDRMRIYKGAKPAVSSTKDLKKV